MGGFTISPCVLLAPQEEAVRDHRDKLRIGGLSLDVTHRVAEELGAPRKGFIASFIGMILPRLLGWLYATTINWQCQISKPININKMFTK